MIGAILQGLASGTAYALMAVGLILVFKGSRVLNLAQGEIGGISLVMALAVWRAMGWVPDPAPNDAGLFAKTSLVVATIVLAAALGIAFERLVMRRLVERPAVQGTMATLGLAVVLINLQLLQERRLIPPTSNSYPFEVPNTVGSGSFGVFGADVRFPLVVAALATAALAVGLTYFFRRTRFGLGVVAATSDNTVARILGVPVNKVYLFTWGVGGALSGLAALIISTGISPGTIKPADMTLAMIIALAAAVVGGLDNIWGGVIGGLMVGVVRAVAEHLFSVSGVKDIAVLVLVLGMLMIRPRGLVGGLGAEVA